MIKTKNYLLQVLQNELLSIVTLKNIKVNKFIMKNKKRRFLFILDVLDDIEIAKTIDYKYDKEVFCALV